MQLERLLLHLKLDGWCVVEDVIPADQIEHVRQSVEATVAEHRNPAAPSGIGHLPGMINFDQSFAPFLADENLLALVGAMLGHHPRISFTTGTINYPGNERGGWHADWPFNQNNAGHIPAPYPDATVHLTTLWMLAPFTEENGGTPPSSPAATGSPNNPTGDNGVDPLAPYPTEVNACGPAGSVLVLDSRLWHATAPNRSHQPRTSVVVRLRPVVAQCRGSCAPARTSAAACPTKPARKEKRRCRRCPPAFSPNCPPQSSPCSATGSNR